MFNQESRMITDQCGYTLKNKESMEACNYRLTNFYTKNCSKDTGLLENKLLTIT